MRELSSEKIKSAFALINLGNEKESEVEHSTKFIPGITFTDFGMSTGENINVIFMQTAPVGKKTNKHIFFAKYSLLYIIRGKNSLFWFENYPISLLKQFKLSLCRVFYFTEKSDLFFQVLIAVLRHKT